MKKTYKDNSLYFVKMLDEMIHQRNYDEFINILSNISSVSKRKILINYVQIFGIFVSHELIFHNQSSLINKKKIRFQEIKILCEKKIYRFSGVEHYKTPFHLIHDYLFVGLINTEIKMKLVVNDYISRDNGFYFPQIEGKLQYELIRFNPRNLGSCPGRCVFCQRSYNLPTKYELDNRNQWTAIQLLESLINMHGKDIIKQIKHALVVTELFGNTKKYISFCQDLKNKLIQFGFKGHFSAICQETRTNKQIECMYKLLDGYDFCFTLECFQNRQKVMSRYKGLPLKNVKHILQKAKEMKFEIIMINVSRPT